MIQNFFCANFFYRLMDQILNKLLNVENFNHYKHYTIKVMHKLFYFHINHLPNHIILKNYFLALNLFILCL